MIYNTWFLIIFVPGVFRSISGKNQCNHLPKGCSFTVFTRENIIMEPFLECNLKKSLYTDPILIENCASSNKDSFILSTSFDAQAIFDKSFQMNAFKCFDFFYFNNLIGFDVNSSFKLLANFDCPTMTTNSIRFFFQNAKLDFYLETKRATSCKQIAQANLSKIQSIFQIGNSHQTLRKVFFYIYEPRSNEPLCPFLFEGANLQLLYVSKVVDSFLKRNLLRFSPLENLENRSFYNINISTYLLRKFQLNLDSTILNGQVFRNLENLKLFGEVKSIEPGLFKSFQKLRLVRFLYEAFDNLIHRGGTHWIRSINEAVHVNTSNQTDFKLNEDRVAVVYIEGNFNIVGKEKNIFSEVLPDEDFCLFRDFPFDQLVLFTFFFWFQHKGPPSCTMLWLGRSYHLFLRSNRVHLMFQNEFMSNTYLRDISEFLKNGSIDNCNLEKRTQACDKNRFVLKNSWTLSDYEAVFLLLEFILFVMILIVSVLGMASNLAIVYSLSLKENQQFVNARQYVYMKLMSVCNLFVLAINILSLVYECQPYNGLFCSPIKLLLFTQYFQIIVGEFLSSVFRFLSNLTYVGFSISRLSLVGVDHCKFVKKFPKFSLLKVCVVFIFVSVVLSCVKVFRLKPEYLVGSHLVDANKEEFPKPYERIIALLYIVSNTSYKVKSRVINAFNMICDVSNYFIFTIVFLSLDIALISSLRKTLDERLVQNSGENVAVLNRTILSVIIYALFSVVLKLPSSFKSILDLAHFDPLVVGKRDKNGFELFYEQVCVGARACGMFEKLAWLLYSVSMSVGVFFWMVFDKRFTIALKVARNRLLSSNAEHLVFMATLEQSLKSKPKKRKRIRSKLT